MSNIEVKVKVMDVYEQKFESLTKFSHPNWRRENVGRVLISNPRSEGV